MNDQPKPHLLEQIPVWKEKQIFIIFRSRFSKDGIATYKMDDSVLHFIKRVDCFLNLGKLAGLKDNSMGEYPPLLAGYSNY